jgi:hypothetical protein
MRPKYGLRAFSLQPFLQSTGLQPQTERIPRGMFCSTSQRGARARQPLDPALASKMLHVSGVSVPFWTVFKRTNC